MTRTIQLLRGTTAQNDAFTGANGEVTVDTETHELRVHDGSTAGGFIIPTKSETQSPLGGGTAGTLLTNSGTPGTVNAISIDAIPTDGSSNPVASNGVYDALALKANTGLDNLTSIGKNIANWSHNVTNCITEIPQNIKLELNNGTLTLKAGSKVYVPNGAGVFNEVTIANDISTTNSGTSGATFVYCNQAGTSLEVSYVSNTGSGTTPPSDGVYYDTGNNAIHYYVGGVIQDTRSFPIAIVQRTGSISSIDQVFNGFGYIGTAIFALPGLKVLVPNGRNDDGSLKSQLFELTTVLTSSYHYSNETQYFGFNRTDGVGAFRIRTTIYDETKNTFNFSPNTLSTLPTCVLCGIVTYSSGTISYFKPFSVAHAVDYNDSEYMAHCAMPGTKYTNLTLGVSGTGYTAPADGYIALSSTFNTNGYLYMYRSGTPRYGIVIPYITSQWVDLCIPVAKGQGVIVQYNGTASVQAFNFIYANGAA